MKKDSNIMIIKQIYKFTHKGVSDDQIPYYYKRSAIAEIWHLCRKAICQNIAPNCLLTPLRMWLYRLCGFKIGKGTFIGMKCYLDDLCSKKIEIGENCIISYGVYFSCHSPYQSHNRLMIKDGVYIGMRASIIAPRDIEIGDNACIGAMTLVNKSIPAGSTAVGVPCKIIDKKQSKIFH